MGVSVLKNSPKETRVRKARGAQLCRGWHHPLVVPRKAQGRALIKLI